MNICSWGKALGDSINAKRLCISMNPATCDLRQYSDTLFENEFKSTGIMEDSYGSLSNRYKIVFHFTSRKHT